MVISNMIWRFLERSFAQGVTLIVSVILARLLDPSVYGVIALVTVLISVLQVFTDSGLGNALIQKKDVDDLDYSTVFWFNAAVSLALYALLFMIAPVFSRFYGLPEIKAVIRVMGISVIVGGIKNIQQAYVARNMIFRKFFKATLFGTVLAAAVGIVMAYRGAGVWALVTQHLVNMSVDTLILWLTVRFRPKFCFSAERLRELLSYGWKLLVSTLLDTLCINATSLVVGKVYTTEELAYFNQGERLSGFLVNNVNISIDSVVLPVLSREQDEEALFRETTRRAVSVSTYIMMPLFVGFAVCAVPFVELAFTSKWLPMVPYLYLFCAINMFYPVHTANLNAIKAKGRSDIFLKLEIIKETIGIVPILLAVFAGIDAMAAGIFVTSVISLFINMWPNRKLIGYGPAEQFRDIFSNIILSAVMGAAAFAAGYCVHGNLLTLVVRIIVGILVYTGLSAITKNRNYIYLLGKIRGFLDKKKRRADK